MDRIKCFKNAFEHSYTLKYVFEIANVVNCDE